MRKWLPQRSGASSNWTFMELKRGFPVPLSRQSWVLIEPLWNWNFSSLIDFQIHRRSNWTFMELKRWSETAEGRRKQSSNWTFMELKRIMKIFQPIIITVLIEPLWNWNYRAPAREPELSRSNWTFMELKQTKVRAFDYLLIVLIEPLWNWNTIGEG